MNDIVGGSGVYTTILDLEKWKLAIRNNTLITEESKQAMFSTDVVSEKYGFGFVICDSAKKRKMGLS
ncbi:hypothetical protein [Flagellimonas okinawensis]|nr:hypothetical protein [[Muricauda] okinawensis]